MCISLRVWCLGGPQQIVLNHDWGVPKLRWSTNDPPLPALAGPCGNLGQERGCCTGNAERPPGSWGGKWVQRAECQRLGGCSPGGACLFMCPLQSGPSVAWTHGSLATSLPSLDALPFSQCPPHATRVPETQFQMSGGVHQFGHSRGPASVWAPAAGWGTPRWAGSELFENWTVLFSHPPPPSAPAARFTAIRTGLGPQQGLF